MDVSETASITTGIAARYASAIFEIAEEDGAISALESGLDDLSAALSESAELRELIRSPVYGREEQAGAIGEIARRMGLLPTLANALGLMAGKRRLFALPQVVARLREMIAEDKGEATAEVTAARALTGAQSKKLAEALGKAVGKNVKLDMTVDESLVGGLVVKVGSQLVDTSIRSRLAALRNAMKEVG